jgi:hypothetical protein
LLSILDQSGVGTTLVAALDDGNYFLYGSRLFESSGKQLNVEVCMVAMGDGTILTGWK